MMPANENKPVTPAQEFQVSPGPHIWKGLSTTRVMTWVLIALLFPVVASVYFFGLRALFVIITSTVSAVIMEWISKKLRNQPFVMDGSAAVTGVLLALTLPPTIDLWMVAVGSAFAIGVVKEAFGGIGQNIFNPALGARAFMAASFATKMTTWIQPFAADAVTTATPLNNAFVWSSRYVARIALYGDLFLGNRGGSLGETSVLAILIGAAILIATQMIDWRIPLTYIGTTVILGWLFAPASSTLKDPLIQLMTGGLMLGAVYMATDYVTAPITHRGRILFAAGCGLITSVIRSFGGLPEGVCYSILLMNSITPLIDRWVKTRPLGFKKPVKAVKNAA